MLSKPISAALIAALCVTTLVLVPATEADSHGGADAIDRYMHDIDKALDRIEKVVGDPAKLDTTLKQIARLQTALVKSKTAAADIPMSTAAKAKYGDDEAAYRRDILMLFVDTLGQAVALEAAVLNGDAAAAKAALEKIDELEDRGHDEFRQGY